MKYKYLILGAGPSGLAFANRLIQNGENDFMVLEQNSTAGGLCRSEQVDGSPLDIGGGHFLDVRRKNVLDFLFGFMPESEWDMYDRNSQIDVKGNIINSPIEANIWQLPKEEQVEYIKSIAIAGCNMDEDIPKQFVDWIYWKMGVKIAKDYMLPYNEKMFGDNLNELGTYWLDKLPNVSTDETIMSCLERKAYGKQPAHASFYYPKGYGYGEIWKRMSDALGDRIRLNEVVTNIDCGLRMVNGYEADNIIVTIPWKGLYLHCSNSDKLYEQIDKLKYNSIVVEYKTEELDTKAQWIYCPDEKLDYHRILVRKNFCKDAKGYWTETNLTRYKESNQYHYLNEYAYPLNTIDKPKAIDTLLNEMKQYNIFGLGRWGEWQHFNSDVVVERAMNLADRLCGAGK